MKAKFNGFSREALKFFAGLAKNNNREWFEARKQTYIEKIKTPMEELVSAISAKMARFAPEYVTEPKRAIFRIYRDTRFSSNKTPYKTNCGALFFRSDLVKNQAAAFYFEVTHSYVGVAGGLYMPGADVLRAVRAHLAENWEELLRLLNHRALKTSMGELQGERLSRPPKGFPADHPAIDLIRAKQWYFWRELPADLALSPKILDDVTSRFEKMTPIVEFLNRPLVAAKKKQKPLTSGWF
ncbi:MAG: DUF2461 domain-containing protein [Bryobacteraceae bacterium]|nr:DUF2461 domain-containing protein [Bryobacteraceae bacterium]